MCSRAPLVVLATMCLFIAVSQGQPDNGSFEIPDEARPNRYYDPNRFPPLNWDWLDSSTNKNYVGLHTQFIPKADYGQSITWTIPCTVDGSTFVLLSTGDALGPGPDSDRYTEYSSIEQIVHICPGDVLYGSYFFGTCDYKPYSDTAMVEATPVDPNSGGQYVLLVSVSVDKLGNFMSTDGWQHFQYAFSGETCCDYLLHCEVRDMLDRSYQSYLALDNFRICRGELGFGDLNRDCSIDYNDFSILSQAWLADCNDPNVLNDPNIPCNLVIQDPNVSDNFIDTKQLTQMSEHWLEQFGD